jgi:putative endonuclease
MAYVYILFSDKLNRYYIGVTKFTPEVRLSQHNSKLFPEAFSVSGIPWKLTHSITCNSIQQALRIEKHIKRMKSVVYIRNLIKYPEMNQKLLNRFCL